MEKTDQIEETEVKLVLSSMWPEDIEADKAAGDLDMLTEVTIAEEPSSADLKRLHELMKTTPEGSSELTKLVKQWAYMQENAVRLLREELKNLTTQREEELKIIEESKFESNEPENLPVLDETTDLFRKGAGSSDEISITNNQFGNSTSNVEESTNNFE